MKKYDTNYDTAAERLKVFKDKYPDHCIITELLSHTLTPDSKFQVDFMARIINKDGLTVATGHASEREGMGDINKTSWVENAETSAIGRALKSFGIGEAGNFASEEEVDNAKDKKGSIQKKEAVDKGSKLTEKAKKGTKAVTLDFITDKRTPQAMKKMYEGFKSVGLSSVILLPVYNRFDKEGKYKGLEDFLKTCPTEELKKFFTEEVLKK